jgi:uncharacterized protein with HEPN domain
MLLRALKYLEDIYLACKDIEEFTEGKTYADFRGSDLFMSAVERKLIIIGEATNLLSKKCDVHLTSESAIIALRNRIIHEYDKIKDEVIWQIINTQLVDLKIEVEKLITENENKV